MSDPLDTRIRELFAELDGAAPDVPPRPAVPAGRPPAWTRLLVPAGGVALVVLVAGILGPQLISMDSGGEAAPATTVAAEPAFTEAAAETTSAPEDAANGGPVSTRPTGNVMVLAEVNLSCRDLQDEVDELALEIPITPDEHVEALMSLVAPLGEWVVTLEHLGAEMEALTVPAAQARAVLDLVATAQESNAVEVYGQVVAKLSFISVVLVDLGALDCEVTGASLP